MLAYDICRCFGRSAEKDYTCPERSSCKRFLATLQPSEGERVPYTMLLNASPGELCTFRIPDKEK